MRKQVGIAVVAVFAVGAAAAVAQIYQGPAKAGSPLVRYTSISQGFNVPWSRNSAQVHTGLDLATPKGNRVFSVKEGVVAKTGSLGGSDGNYALVFNRDGTVNGYLHLNLSVKKNVKVAAGQQIGTIFKDHLHFNQCKQVDGCQHGAFPNPTYKNMPTSKVTRYYVKPRI